jgi:hypothetical protein
MRRYEVPAGKSTAPGTPESVANAAMRTSEVPVHAVASVDSAAALGESSSFL